MYIKITLILNNKDVILKVMQLFWLFIENKKIFAETDLPDKYPFAQNRFFYETVNFLIKF